MKFIGSNTCERRGTCRFVMLHKCTVMLCVGLGMPWCGHSPGLQGLTLWLLDHGVGGGGWRSGEAGAAKGAFMGFGDWLFVKQCKRFQDLRGLSGCTSAGRSEQPWQFLQRRQAHPNLHIFVCAPCTLHVFTVFWNPTHQ